MAVRDHAPIILNKFNGLWDRDDPDSCPMDHFRDCDNIKFIGTNSFGTRDGIGISQTIGVPISNIKRIYNYPTQTGNTLIVLAFDDATNSGIIYHVVDPSTVYGPLLTIVGMTDFAFVAYAGRGYISPFTSYTITSLEGNLNQERGLQNEFLYVYAGDGTAARKAAGSGMSGTMTIANGAAGHTDPGFHIFGFVSQTLSGYNAPPSILTSFTTSALSSVSFGSIPTSGDPHVTKRLLVATKVIPSFNGDLSGYQFFFVPDAVINNNTDTFLNNISFYDADLLQDASGLLQNYTEIPAVAVLSLYHNRLVAACTYTDISLALVSNVGEPEAINQITGLIVVPLDGNSITNAWELRDVLYFTKRSKTTSYVDNGGTPSSWTDVLIDPTLGSSVHGIAAVIDAGSSNVDFAFVCTYQGISLFNGKYQAPELSWKVENRWRGQDRNEFRKIQIVHRPVQKEIYIILPDRSVLVGNYGNGMDYKNMRWGPWTFQMGVNTICVANIDDLIFGADLG